MLDFTEASDATALVRRLQAKPAGSFTDMPLDLGDLDEPADEIRKLHAVVYVLAQALDAVTKELEIRIEEAAD